MSNDLFQAVNSNDIPRVYALVREGSDVNSRNDKEETPLHYAVSNNELDMVKVLIKLGADANAQDKYGHSPLHLANGTNLRMVITLINAGADVNIQDHVGNIPLYIMLGSNDLDVVKTMIRAGVDPNVENIEEKTLLNRAIKSNYVNVEIIKALADAGADVNHRDKDGHTYLYYASKNLKIDIVKVLLDSGAIPDRDLALLLSDMTNEIDKEGEDDLQRILKERANKTTSDESVERTINLHTKTSTFSNIVKMIKSSTEELKVSMKAYDNPLRRNEAASSVAKELTTEMRKETATLKKLAQELKDEGFDVNVELKKKGFDINKVGGDGEFPIVKSLLQGDIDVFNVLIDVGANVNVRDKYGRNLIQIAIERYGVDRNFDIDMVVDKLIQAGVNVNTVSDNGNNAIKIATYYNLARIVKKLIDAGATK